MNLQDLWSGKLEEKRVITWILLKNGLTKLLGISERNC
jgi:hypothetical protein